jgi:hypothetical protein
VTFLHFTVLAHVLAVRLRIASQRIRRLAQMSQQQGLALLDGQHVVRAGVHDLCGDAALAAHRIEITFAIRRDKPG